MQVGNRMKRLLIGGAIVLAGIGAVGGTAGAGEVNGNNKPTPINDFRAGSICSFSGLNDDPTGGGNPDEAGKIQNWGVIPKAGKVFLTSMGQNPGVACRGYASQGR